MKSNIFKTTLYSALAVLALILVIASLHIVPSGTRGVERSYGEIQETIHAEGLHVLRPWTTVYNYEVLLQKTEAKGAAGASKDQQTVHTDISLNWSFDPSKVNYTLSHFGKEDYIDKSFVYPALFEVFKSVTGEYNSEELLTKRTEVSDHIVAKLRVKLSKYNILVSDINLVNFAFSKAYQDSVENKVISGQKREQALIDFERTKTDVSRDIAIAEGRAKAIAIEAQAINSQGGEAYVRMKATEKWNGVLPTTIAGGGTVPFINIK
jgi:prohibitin 2